MSVSMKADGKTLSEVTVPVGDNLRSYNEASLIRKLMRRFSLDDRDVIILGILVAAIFMFVLFACLFAASNKREIAMRPAARKGVLFDNTCFSTMCLETMSYTLTNMNLSADPCDDFYQYSCGSYRLTHPITEDNKWHTVYRDLYNKNKQKLRHLMEAPVKRTMQWTSERKLKALYQSCMDDYKREKMKGQPFLDQILKPIGGWWVLGTWNSSTWDLNEVLKKAQTDFWLKAFWGTWVGWDWNNRKTRAIEIYPAGTGRYMRWSYYINAKSQKVRDDYKKYMRRVATLIVRDSGVTVNNHTGVIEQFVTDAFGMEKSIAKAARKMRWSRDRYDDANMITLDNLRTQTGNLINWTAQMTYLFNKVKVTGKTKVVVTSMDYLKNLTKIINDIPQADRKRTLHNYLVWRAMEMYTGFLSAEYYHANREMIEDTIGFSEFMGLWEMCFWFSKWRMNQALGALFIEDHFADKNKEKVTDITKTSKEAISTALKAIPWFDDKTKAYAEQRIRATTIKIGYPDFLTHADEVDKLYQSVTINITDWFGNVMRLRLLDKKRWNDQLAGKESDDQWFFAPYTTNMMVLFGWNIMEVPAGMLQFPFYDNTMPHYFTFGSFGSLLGHFLIHIIDESSRKWDKSGKKMSTRQGWWTDATMEKYKGVKQCVIDSYKNTTQGPFTAPNGDSVMLPVKGASVATEEIAVTSGLAIAQKAYRMWVAKTGVEKTPPSADQLTSDQIFFISFAQTHCYNMDMQQRWGRIIGNYRLMGEARVNLAVSQLKDFSKAFKCSPDSKLNLKKRCTLY